MFGTTNPLDSAVAMPLSRICMAAGMFAANVAPLTCHPKLVLGRILLVATRS